MLRSQTPCRRAGIGLTTMNFKLRSCLASLKVDYASIVGAPFEHFFCPFLFRDEDVTLCKGHVLNQAFGVGKGKWTVQREDVESFFGSRFESDFTKLRYREALATEDVLGDQRLRRELRPRVYTDEREIDHFIPQGDVPDHFTTLRSTENGLPSELGLKVHPGEVEEAIEADWRIEVELDLRVGSLVSLLKAAHLTKFLLFGYSYVFSPSGELLGQHLLGRLFRQCKTASRRLAQEYAKEELADYVNMVRPLLKTELNLRGTVLDRQVLVAWSASGFPWATIVIVPAGTTLHGVMMPVGDGVEGIKTWYDFMMNDNESITVKLARHVPDIEEAHWQLSKATWRIQWPKGTTLVD